MSEGDAPKAVTKVFDLEEVKKHTREDDCWLVVDGDVFDVTEFLDEHPGGFDIIISNTGTHHNTFPPNTCSHECTEVLKSTQSSIQHDHMRHHLLDEAMANVEQQASRSAARCLEGVCKPGVDAGKDATEDFDEIGHSKSARELLSNYKIGAYKVGAQLHQVSIQNGTHLNLANEAWIFQLLLHLDVCQSTGSYSCEPF